MAAGGSGEKSVCVCVCVCMCGGGAGISRGGVIFIIEATAAREQREG